VLVVGVGALGCPAARIVADSLGRWSLVTLVDPDRVELSNLQRQPLFDDADIGSFKVEVAARNLRSHAECRFETVRERLDETNAQRLIAGHDYVIDATDSPETKFLINDVAVRLAVPFTYAGVVRTGGQAMAVVPGKSACLRCVFPEEPGDDEAGACSNMGILAPVAGVVGSLAAANALGHLSGNDFEAGTMTIYELRGTRLRRVAFGRRSDCTVCASTDKSPSRQAPQATREAGEHRENSLQASDGTAPDAESADPRRQ
jgi:molybdopterin/thiamine biosynthesis adenylyltransferase